MSVLLFLQLSELKLDPQSVPFPLEDLPLGPCTCGPLLERYKQDLERVRCEVQSRAQELQGVRQEVHAVQLEHRATLEDLASHDGKLRDALQQKAAVEEEVGVNWS